MNLCVKNSLKIYVFSNLSQLLLSAGFFHVSSVHHLRNNRRYIAGLGSLRSILPTANWLSFNPKYAFHNPNQSFTSAKLLNLYISLTLRVSFLPRVLINYMHLSISSEPSATVTVKLHFLKPVPWSHGRTWHLPMQGLKVGRLSSHKLIQFRFSFY